MFCFKKSKTTLKVCVISKQNLWFSIASTSKLSYFFSNFLSHLLLPLYFYSSQQFCFFLLFLSVFTPLHFFFPCYLLQFFNCTLYIHITMNSKTSKMHTIYSRKRKLLSMVSSFFLVLKHPTHHIHFFIYSLFFN